MWYSLKRKPHFYFMSQFKPFNQNAIVETDRLVLRYMKSSDSHAIFLNINSDKEVLKYFIDKYVEDEANMTLDKTIDYCIANARYLFAIEIKETHEVIGMILQCSTASETFNFSEIGYAIGRKYWNNNYATEALYGMIRFLFDRGVHKVVVSHLVGNNASKRVIEKNGLTYEGRRKDEVYYHEQYYDVDYYYLINETNNG